MSKLVVNAFKMVDVHHQAAQFGVMFATLGKSLLKLHVKGTAVKASGEGISRP